MSQPSQYVPLPGAVPFIVLVQETGDWEARYGSRDRFKSVWGKGGIDSPPVIPTGRKIKVIGKIIKAHSKPKASEQASVALKNAGTKKHLPATPPAAPSPIKHKRRRGAPKDASSPAPPLRCSPRRVVGTPASAAPAPASASQGNSSPAPPAPPARASKPRSLPAPAPAPASVLNAPTSPSPSQRSSRSKPDSLTASSPLSHNGQQAAPSPKAKKADSVARPPTGGLAKAQMPPVPSQSLAVIAHANTKERKRPGRKPSSQTAFNGKSRLGVRG